MGEGERCVSLPRLPLWGSWRPQATDEVPGSARKIFPAVRIGAKQDLIRLRLAGDGEATFPMGEGKGCALFIPASPL